MKRTRFGRVKFESYVPEVELATKGQMAKALTDLGFKAEQYAKLFCPVDTGRLRNSITNDIDEANNTMIVGTNVEYATYVEMGTSKKNPRPYIKPSIDMVGNVAEGIVKKYLQG